MARVREELLPWDSQPQEAVQFRADLARELGFYGGFINPQVAWNEGQSFSPSGLSPSPTRDGLAISNTTGTAVCSYPFQGSPQSSELTIVLRAVRYGSQPDSGFGTALYAPKIGGSQDPFDWFIKDSGERVRMNTTTFDSSSTSWETTENWPIGEFQTAVLTWSSPGIPSFYRNGRLLSLSSSFGAVSGVLKPSSNLSINLSALRLNGAVSTALIFNKAWTGDQVAQYTSGPTSHLQLFAPRSIWVPVSAGGGAATHATTGVLTGAGSTVAGTAAHKAKHATTGVLTGPGSAVVGSAARTRQHPTSGALTGAGSAVVGSAARTRQHPSSGTLVGPGSAVVGVAAHVVAGGPHATTGALVGAGSAVVGTAAHKAKHATSGVLVGAGAVVAGTAARIAGAVTHATSGVLVGDGAVVSGIATGPASLVVAGGGGWLPNMRRKTRKQIHEERVKLGILPPDVVKAAKKAAAVVVADEPSPVQAYRQDPQEANKVFLRSLGAPQMTPDYTRAIQAQIKIQQDEEEDLMLFM